MNKTRSHRQGVLAAMGLLVLIFNNDLAFKGAEAGIDLCIRAVIPCLFPFFLLSTVITKSFSSSNGFSFFTNFLGIPRSASSVMVPSFLGGYPVGAKCIGDLYCRNQISKQSADRILAFCSNAGPSFLFGMVAKFFSEKSTIWLLWAIHILSAVLTAMCIPETQEESHRSSDKVLEESSMILSSAKALLLVCCWVVSFRIIITFGETWLFRLLPVWMNVFLTGILELTNGCCELYMIADEKLRFILCASMLSFGGICVIFQTASVTKGLSLGAYVRGKLIQTAFSFILSCIVAFIPGLSPGLFSIILLIILLKQKKAIEIPGVLLYNKENKLPEA